MSAEKKEDILREMRMGNSGDMPFAYLVGMPDTFEEFPSGTKMRKINVKQVTVKELADRFEAAFKRESVGNVAAMREALYDIVMLTMKVGYSIHGDVACGIIASKAKRALSSPPRNCDLPFDVEGTTWNDADKAWRAFKRTHLDAYFDTPNLIRCIEWLLAPAEKGGAE